MTPLAAYRLRIEHTSEFRYRESVSGSFLILRLQPRQCTRQRLLGFALHISPPADPVAFGDSFGNACHLVSIYRRHVHTVVRSTLEVEVSTDRDPIDQRPSWESLTAATDPIRYWDFLNPSRLVFPCAALDSFIAAREIRRSADPLSSLLDTAAELHRTFTYEPGSTAVHSPLTHTLETGRGVCQDYTHVMLAIARSWRIPGRYVSGYLHNEGTGELQSAVSASHAWAEFRLPGLGWVGIDPTNNTVADHRHVPVAIGRDYHDAAPTRGTIFGGGDSGLEVRVSVAKGGAAGVAAPPRVETRTYGLRPEALPSPGIVSDLHNQ